MFMEIYNKEKIRYLMKVPILLFTAALTILKVNLLPNFSLLAWLGIAIMVDFLSAMGRSVILNEPRTSKKLQGTIKKFIMYFGALSISIIFLHIKDLTGYGAELPIAPYLNNGLVIFMVYVEMVSILENLIAIDSKDTLSVFILKPLHRLLTFQLKNNPIKKAADNEK